MGAFALWGLPWLGGLTRPVSGAQGPKSIRITTRPHCVTDFSHPITQSTHRITFNKNIVTKSHDLPVICAQFVCRSLAGFGPKQVLWGRIGCLPCRQASPGPQREPAPDGSQLRIMRQCPNVGQGAEAGRAWFTGPFLNCSIRPAGCADGEGNEASIAHKLCSGRPRARLARGNTHRHPRPPLLIECRAVKPFWLMQEKQSVQ